MAVPRLSLPKGQELRRKDARRLPVSARTRIATAGKVLAMAKVYEPRESDSESDSEPPLPSLLGVKGLQEDALSELLSSSEDELLVAQEAPATQRSTFRSLAPTQISVAPSASQAQRCAGAGGLGAMAGASGGALLGLAAGVLPAPLTLGLSVPMNAGLGSLGGMLLGSAGGLVCQSLDVVEVEPVQLETHRSSAVLLRLHSETPCPALRGTLLGTSVGATAGSAMGAVVGACAGLPPALLTFGLSVPVMATVGSSLGLCVGGLAGGATGLTACWLRRIRATST